MHWFSNKGPYKKLFVFYKFKGTAMEIKKALINDSLRVSKVSWKFHIPTIYTVTVIYP